MTAPFDRILVIDFETYYDSREYTLRKMTTEEYVRDPRFKAFGLCVKEVGGKQPTKWIRGEDIPAWADGIDWSRTAVLAHNAQFDVTILSWRYGVQPAFILDTLSMARAVRGVEGGNSLAQIAADFGLPEKGKAIHKTDGVLELLPAIEAELADYCAHDVYLCEQIFLTLSKGYPKSELRLIDLTLKMYTRPLLELDQDMLTDALHTEREQRESLLKRLDVEEADLASNPKFAEILKRLGVSPPMKKKKPTVKTPNPEGNTFAFAKNDALFQALLNSENEDIALLCEARLKVKSTTERTRAQRFLDISKRGRLPVPLSYYGALSGRWTAAKGSSINMQNLKRGSFLRSAIMAPEGYVLGVGDLSQIEPRVLAWLADYEDMLAIFRAKGDAYAMFGAQMFNIPGMTKESHSDLRQSAKSALLGCLSGDTRVLTPRGWIALTDVQVTDTVWDGEDWVKHQGVIPQGEKDVLTAVGLSATPDHKVLTEHGWVEWDEVLKRDALNPLKQRMQTYDIAFAGPRNRYTVLTSNGPIIVHNCGYGLGWASFSTQLLTGFLGAPPIRYDKTIAKKLGVTSDYIERFIDWEENILRMQEIPHTCSTKDLLIHCIAAKKIIELYRAAAHPVAGFWELCESLIQRSLADGEEYRHKCLVFRKEEIVLPNGMSLRYPNIRQQKDARGRPRWVYGPDATSIYGGKITNNCLAEGTLVFTDVGWVAIEKITTSHKVHDGVEFVEHSGKVFNGLQTCVKLFGVSITPEHKVLINDGWREASQVQEPYWPDLRHVDGASARLVYWENMAVAVPMSVWEKMREAGIGRGEGIQEGWDSELWVRHKNIDRKGEHVSRDEYAPSVHCVEKHGKSLHEAFRAGIQKLRWAGYNGVRTLVSGFRNILGRYAEHVSTWAGIRSKGQQRSLCPGELPLGNAPRKRDEPQKNRATSGCNNAEQEYGDSGVNDLLQTGARVAAGAVDSTSERKKPVYDILNAGPRSRFVVLGHDGPFIVHNCVQGVARIVMTDGMLRTAKRYPVAGTVHDEQIIVVPESESKEALAWMLEQMTLEPSYMPGIPLAAEGGVHRRYGLAKK